MGGWGASPLPPHFLPFPSRACLLWFYFSFFLLFCPPGWWWTRVVRPVFALFLFPLCGSGVVGSSGSCPLYSPDLPVFCVCSSPCGEVRGPRAGVTWLGFSCVLFFPHPRLFSPVRRCGVSLVISLWVHNLIYLSPLFCLPLVRCETVCMSAHGWWFSRAFVVQTKLSSFHSCLFFSFVRSVILSFCLSLCELRPFVWVLRG